VILVTQQALQAVAYLHGVGVYHRDLNLTNLLVNPMNWKLKIVDFGSACSGGFGERLDLFEQMSPPFMAPEVITLCAKSRIGAGVDVWAIGVLMYYLTTGEYPFGQGHARNIKQKILNESYVSLDGKYGVEGLIDKIFKSKPGQRPTASQVIFVGLTLKKAAGRFGVCQKQARRDEDHRNRRELVMKFLLYCREQSLNNFSFYIQQLIFIHLG
jgi:serine/threonine protein kinase